MKALLASAVTLALLAGAPALAWAQHDPSYQDPHGKKRHKQKADKPDRGQHAGKRDRDDRRAAGGRYDAPTYASGTREKAERDPQRRKYDRGDIPVKYGGYGASGYDRGAQGGKSARESKYDAPGYVPKYVSDPYRRKYDRDDIPVKYGPDPRASRDGYGPGYVPGDWRDAAWRSGDVLPSAYTGKRYAIEDYGSYDLGAPPRGHRWVRYGDDAILVNRRNGVILSVERDVFG